MDFKKEVKRTVLVFCLLAIISIVRQIWLHRQNFILTPGQSVMIFFCYLISTNVWWNGIKRRVVSKSVRRCLIAEHWLMVAGVVMRLLQNSITTGIDTYGRLTGYFFVIPSVLLFLFGFYAAFLLGKPRDVGLPPVLKLLLFPAFLMIGLTLTNDMHQLVYRQVSDEARAGVNAIFEPTGFFYLICVWIVVLEFAKIILVFRYGRRIRNPRLRWIPNAISVGFLFFVTPYILTGFAVPDIELLEFYVGLFFFEGLLWESLIALGVLPVNLRYGEIFLLSDVAMAIYDPDGILYACSSKAEPVTAEQFSALREQRKILLADGSELCLGEIRGGYVVWKNDTEKLRVVLEELREKKNELESEDIRLRVEIHHRHEKENVERRKQIYDMVRTVTAADNAEILTILKRIRQGEDERQLLPHAIELAIQIKNTGIRYLEKERKHYNQEPVKQGGDSA